MSLGNLLKKICRRIRGVFVKPIRVFCFHQVSDVFEPETMWECDWTQTDVFKKKILALKEKYTFVSLTEAYNHIANDIIRLKNYAALTADDGWASVKNIIPWLAEQGIPVTLFLNPLYLDGKHYQSRETEKLLTFEDVKKMANQYGSLVTIASHGWSHKDCLKMSDKEFEKYVQKAECYLNSFEGKILYYAFTYGNYRIEQVEYLKKQGIIPVFIDNKNNYDQLFAIHRELLDGDFF